jgi:integrase
MQHSGMPSGIIVTRVVTSALPRVLSHRRLADPGEADQRGQGGRNPGPVPRERCPSPARNRDVRNNPGVQVRAWFGRPLWDMQPADADAYFGRVLRETAKGTRLARAQALKTYFLFLELRHKVEIHNLTGRVLECPIDEVNRPRGGAEAKLRIPPTTAEVDALFAGWRQELASCRKFAPTARNYAAARLMAEVGLRVNEACRLDLHDIKWDLGRFGKLHVRHPLDTALANGLNTRRRARR